MQAASKGASVPVERHIDELARRVANFALGGTYASLRTYEAGATIVTTNEKHFEALGVAALAWGSVPGGP